MKKLIGLFLALFALSANAAVISGASIGGISNGQADGRYAALAGRSTQAFGVANATTAMQAVAFGQTALFSNSMVQLNTANGYGSTNTVIRRFSNIVTNTGTDITYADSATLGATFTINTNGFYAISYDDSFAFASDMGLSLNSTQLTTTIISIAAANQLSESTTGSANWSGSSAWTGYLVAGSVVRAHDSGDTTGVGRVTHFTISRVQ